MRTLLIALASALLLAYLITELTARVWPDSAIALFAVAFVLLFVNGIFNARLSVRAAPAPDPAREGGPKERRGRGTGGKSDNRANEKSRQRERKPAPRPDKSAGPKESGTVKWYNRSKGYGFIVRENGEEIFVHQRSILTSNGQRGSLRDGQSVTFTVAQRDKGLQAENVSASD